MLVAAQTAVVLATVAVKELKTSYTLYDIPTWILDSRRLIMLLLPTI